ncbi:MAG: prolyl aminopeptidase [Gammaproteobacteria bacterium]
MRTLYPEIEPYNKDAIAVDAVHDVYMEECGNPDGIPVLFLHGGPGSGSNENHRRYFNPDKYRIVLFDQRGCNRSVPRGETRNNTTQDLLADIEVIRERLQIEQWLVFGGSWGSTLGLLYAQAHPGRILGLILRGSFLARQADLDWFVKFGANRVFPDAWEEFIRPIPEDERDNLIEAYHRRVHGGDAEEQLAAARRWATWAGKVVTWTLPVYEPGEEDTAKMIHEVAIETHYAKNRYFVEENHILDNMNRIPEVPVRLIHGRRDILCPLTSSWLLHRALPQSTLNIVREGGHLAGEPPMIDALVSATDAMAAKLSEA